MKFAYLGPKGTFSEIAANEYLEKYSKNLELTPYESILEVVTAVDSGNAKEGIVPIENSVEGSLNITLDMLADRNIKLKIIHEIDLEVCHNLISNRGVQQGDIAEVYAHPQALAQCQNYLRRNFPGAQWHPTLSNANAVQQVKEMGMTNAVAIAPEIAATEWEMEILDKAIQDSDQNKTRFVVISKNPIRKTEKRKTSVVFATRKDKSGALHEILGLFAKRQINLTKIESRPRKQTIGEYLFFIDFEGSDEEPEVESLLKELGAVCSYFKKLGSYNY